jgi:hypothetical protein
VWRWREAIQHDFAARMDWTVKEFADANHPPSVVVNGKPGSAPIYLSARAGETLDMRADGSSDPDGDALSYRWFQYDEAGYLPGNGRAALEVLEPGSVRTRVRAAAACRPAWKGTQDKCPSGDAHLILAVSDDGTPRLTRYRRVIIRVAQ